MSIALANFLVGFFLANAIPHLVLAQSEIRFLSLFGFRPKANYAYSAWNACLAVGIAVYAYGWAALLQHAMFWGVFVIFASYVAVGRVLFLRWNRR